ncbi:cadherin repeat domain-containing protein [Salinibius halmophilus]|uniref:cadherin repeat domain-containing protein n=1 Tax=Salinibius halmophilus TaxID=1853216 RepID=UPI000E671BDE|nr:cadherin repeat domain-containing protein [Salinibius halmophilus]
MRFALLPISAAILLSGCNQAIKPVEQFQEVRVTVLVTPEVDPKFIDSDGDGVQNALDDFPFNGNETLDSDGDGLGNNADQDDDNDGVLDAQDRFPLNADEWADADNDGIADNQDSDDDNDGVVDSQDRFPNNASEWADNDNDGIGNNADTDDDNDGVDDTFDAFPFNASESLDTDGDGIGNKQDTDDDGDGTLDSEDLLPLNAANATPPVWQLSLLPGQFGGTARIVEGAKASNFQLEDLNQDRRPELIVSADAGGKLGWFNFASGAFEYFARAERNSSTLFATSLMSPTELGLILATGTDMTLLEQAGSSWTPNNVFQQSFPFAYIQPYTVVNSSNAFFVGRYQSGAQQLFQLREVIPPEGERVIVPSAIGSWSCASITANRNFAVADITLNGLDNIVMACPNSDVIRISELSSDLSELLTLYTLPVSAYKRAELELANLNAGSEPEIVAVLDDRLLLITNQGNTFTSNLLGRVAAVTDISVLDVNRDGRKDIVLAHESGGLSWFAQNENGAFLPSQLTLQAKAKALAAYDADQDGYDDLIYATQEAGDVFVAFNQPDLTVTVKNGASKVATLVAEDAEQGVTYRLVSGDGFAINRQTGELSFARPAVHFANGQNKYSAIVEATDGDFSISLSIDVTVVP